MMIISNCCNSGDMVTVMSPEGKPIQVSASSLQSAGVQNQMGIYDNQIENKKNCPKMVNKSKVHYYWVLEIYRRI